MVVRTLQRGLPFFSFYSTRSSRFLHQKPNQSFLRALLCSLVKSPMRHAMSKLIESCILWKLPLEKYGLKPDYPFEGDYASCRMAIMPENFFSEADKDRILFKRSESKWWFCKDGIEFDDNIKIKADVVVFATGYDGKKKVHLTRAFSHLIGIPFWGTIQRLILNMAFVGYLESVSNFHSSELRSVCLARLLDNKFKLPSVEQMLEQTSKEVEVPKKTTRFYKRHCLSTFSINHSDEICEAMGWTSWRKNTCLAEAFSPYGSQDYLRKH